MRKTQALNPERAWQALTILLLDDARIASAHAAVFGDPSPTDVISLAYRPLPGGHGWTAEVLINVEQACREGVRRAGGIARELALYLAHGCDHLSGADDATPQERRRMRRRENMWLAEPAIRSLWSQLIQRPPERLRHLTRASRRRRRQVEPIAL